MEMKIKKIKIIELEKGKFGEYSFSEGVNIINGGNGSGKSSLIKSIMYCLGYEIKNWSTNFKVNGMIFELNITVNGKEYSLKRFREYFILNNKIMKLLEYREKILKCLNIKLKLSLSKANSEVIPYPTDILMYNYLDQDSSWDGKIFYNNHKNYSMYAKKELEKVLSYYLGISNDFINELILKESDLKRKSDSLKQNIEKLEYSQKILNYDEENKISLDINDFEFEIKELEKKLKNIYNEENIVKYKIFDTTKKIQDIDLDIRELEVIYSDLKEKNKKTEKFICKTCNSKINQEMFLKKYDIEKDMYSIFSIYELQIKEKEKLVKQLEKCTQDNENIKKELFKIENILKTKKENISLKEVIESKSKIEGTKKINEFLENFKKEKSLIQVEIKELSKKIRKEKEKLKSLTTEYKNKFNILLDEINLLFEKIDLEQMKDKFLDFSKMPDTGAAKNLYYMSIYFVYWKLLDESSTIKIPFILDTIIKDEMDMSNKKNISKLIEENVLTLENQIIFGYTEKANIVLENRYSNVIDLTSKERVCDKEITEIEEKALEFVQKKIKELSDEKTK